MNTPVLPTPALRGRGEERFWRVLLDSHAPDLSFPLVPLDKVGARELFGGSFSSWVPAVDRYGGVFVPVCSDGFDELDEGAAGLWDSVLGPRSVVEVAD